MRGDGLVNDIALLDLVFAGENHLHGQVLVDGLEPALLEGRFGQAHFLTIDLGHHQTRSSDHLRVEVEASSCLVAVVHEAESKLSKLRVLL